MSTRSGATALPNWGSTVCFDLDVAISQAFVKIQQPTTVPIANLVSIQKTVSSGNLIDVNTSYIVYGVKNGLVRIIDRHSAARTLLRGHTESITDVAFFGNISPQSKSDGTEANVVATVGGGTENNVLIWRILKNGPEDIATEKLLEIKLRCAERIIWHPFNPNQLVLSHRVTEESDGSELCSVAVASHIITTNLNTEPHRTEGHAVCYGNDEYESNVIPGALQLIVGGLLNPKEARIQDMCWSQKDTRYILTVHSDGYIRLWDLLSRVFVSPSGEQLGVNHTNATNLKVSAKCLVKLQVTPQPKNYKDSAEESVSDDLASQRCMFLHHYDHAGQSSHLDNEQLLTTPFITSTRNGRTVTLWTPFSSTGSPPSTVKIFELSKGSYQLTLCTTPQESYNVESHFSYPSTYLILADELEGYIYALHLAVHGSDKRYMGGSSACTVRGYDFIVPFKTLYPVYSLCTQSLESSKDIQLFCVQSKAIQMLTLASTKCCAPPPLSDDDDILPPGVNCIDTTYEDRYKNFVSSSYEYEEFEEVDDKLNRLLAAGGTMDQDNSEDDRDSTPPLNAEDSNTFIESLPNISPGIRAGTFANWLGSLASVEPQSYVPPTPQVTPHVTPLVKSRIADKSTLSGIRDISDLSLPASATDSSTSYGLHRNSPPTEAVQTPLLSPMEFFSESTQSNDVNLKLDQSKVKGKHPDTALSSVDEVVPLPTAPVDIKKNLPCDKKSLTKAGIAGSLKIFDQKATKTSSKDVSVSKTDGKVTILKRAEESESQDSIKSSIPFSVEEYEIILRKVVASQFKQQEPMLVMEIQKSVRSEMHSFLLPSLSKTITQSIEQAISKTLESSVAIQIKEASSMHLKDMIEGVKDPINDTLYSSMRELMIPAFESATKQMFGQISSTLQSGLTAHHHKGNDDLLKVVHHMAERIDAMSKMIEVLIVTVNLLSSNKNVVDERSAVVLSVPDPKQQLQLEILTLLNSKEYERAFTRALSITDVDFALLVCKNADLQIILEGESPCLSQPILVCLMQQLGSNIANSSIEDGKLILAWLQSIAIVLDPNDDSIKKHVVNVCAQVTDNINRKLSNCDASLRRPLQMLLQVIRGIGTI